MSNLPTSRSGWRVTVSGVDDSVLVSDLLALSAEFPFVEWAINREYGRMGVPGFVSTGWCNRMIETRPPGVPLALHVFGECADCLMDTFPIRSWDTLDGTRVQLNGFTPAKATNMKRPEATVILPCTSTANLVAASLFVEAKQKEFAADGKGPAHFDFLYVRTLERDRGQWPSPQSRHQNVGYAGGIGPDTIRDVLYALRDHTPTWLDVGRNVLSGNRIDLTKVRSVLEQVEAWPEQP